MSFGSHIVFASASQRKLFVLKRPKSARARATEFLEQKRTRLSRFYAWLDFVSHFSLLVRSPKFSALFVRADLFTSISRLAGYSSLSTTFLILLFSWKSRNCRCEQTLSVTRVEVKFKEKTNIQILILRCDLGKMLFCVVQMNEINEINGTEINETEIFLI